MIVISVHIPKTAGTSLAHVFDEGTDRAILYDYRFDYSNFLFQGEEEKEFRQALPFVRRRFRFIHGHFYLAKYAGVLPDAARVTCLREPVARILSQYKHTLRAANLSDWRYRGILEGMTPVDFAKDPTVAKAQILHLGGIDPGELDFLFLNDDLDEGLELFKRRWPGLIMPWVRVPRLNQGDVRSGRPELPMPAFDPAELNALVAEEAEYYRQAVEAYARQKARLSG